jgi:hypothetical protein
MLWPRGLLASVLPILLGLSAVLPAPGDGSSDNFDWLGIRHNVFFQSSDCSGTPFLGSASDPPGSLLPALAVLGPTRRVFVQVPGAEVLPIAPGSVLVDATTCWALSQPSFGPVLAVQGFHAAELAPLAGPRLRH